ncbi:MAG: HNH endonuclease [Acidobacteriia bacterium]|nr:HNH endonuclease [Terriglobia bacterium]
MQLNCGTFGTAPKQNDGWLFFVAQSQQGAKIFHHREFRSHSGHDSEENLITLCTRCHADIHR